MAEKPTYEQLEQRVRDLEQAESKRKRVEEKLLMSAQNFSTLADNAYDGIVIVTADGSHLYANQRAAEITGYSVTELLEVNMRQLAHPDKIAIFEDRVRRRISGEEFANPYQTEIFTKYGVPVPVEIAGSRTVWHGQPADLIIMRDITERKRAEEALLKSERKLLSLIDTTSDWVWEVDSKGYFTYVSPKTEDFLGYNVQEILGHNLADFLAEDYVESAWKYFRRRCEAPEPFAGLQVALTRKDGRRVIAEMSGNPVYEKDGEFSGYFGCDKDITEKLLAESDLRESEKKYRLVAENVRDVIWTMDMNLNFTYISPSVERLRGYSADEVMNQTLDEILKPESVSVARAIITEIFEKAKKENHRISKKSYVVELEQKRKDGSTVWTEVNTAFLTDSNGQPSGIIGVTRDISERKQADKALRESEERYRSLVENIDLGITLINSEHKIIMTNAAQGRFFNKSADEFVGHECFREFEKRDVVCPHCPGVKAMATGKPQEVETEGVTDNGSRLAVHIYAFPTHDLNGAVTGFIEVVEDITARRDSQELIQKLTHQLIKAQEIERQKISRELHDSIAQDLSASRIICDLLIENKLVSSSEIKKNISLVSETLRSTIMAVRDLSYSLHPSGLESLGLVNTIYQHCEEFSEKNNIKVDFQSACINNLQLDFDTKINLYRLVQECLNNIRQHSGASNVKIKLVSALSNIELHIEDNGKGFDVNERLVTAMKEKRMGIRSMKERVALLQGQMFIESTPGEGTKVSVTIPHKNEKIVNG
ncbi:hypothetical protein PITCH_A1810002 [uncultured Desulfobacterium sp.]|uniref:PAS domain S-box protein n=1 Tax=uncultured Desulfobacterium sp. TaxID=201089 RepID=A0A445MV35_9BACT|nr:hypothetical protein PITCH_A1810002 [uncultured Desulfobacterium sp.]